MIVVWNWLVNNDLLRDIINWVIGVTMGAIWAQFRLTPILHRQSKDIRENTTEVRKNTDMLDTTKPGGLTDVIQAIQSLDTAVTEKGAEHKTPE